MRPLSVRARLTALYGGMFLLSGIVLVVIVYLLVSQTLPSPASFADTVMQVPAYLGTPADTVPAVPATPMDTKVIDSLAAYRSSTLTTLLVQSGAALLITAALAVVLGWFVARRVLRPLHDITATARRLGAEDLGRRIKLVGPEDELKELADTFDGMLDRLSGSFDSQRRFVANASHELRTPLALQRTLIEVALLGDDVPAQTRLLGTRLLDANARTERVLEGLLVLARSDRGLADRTPVRLDHLVETVVEGFPGVEVVAVPRTVAGDPVLLERLIVNLIDNAVTYNRPGGWVRVEVADTPALVVRNTGPVIEESTVDALFEPFHRGPGDRTDSAHSGLGLSIVRSVAAAHGGRASAQARADGGLEVTVRLP
ncbi:sensor histidine kinase [Kutzneria sp. CA-103260]|uniref:sensor histidine kinase n=1 Tax=Kutzneria sp. CA-103260 TaxID=2802641 RepID=UPI001BAA98D5|nr:ATP-binding protein [Kutzneria sp. CA-103260]QUQ67545.1 two-component system histidine kinase [Kutzneria sp. CA-103260]